MHRAFAVFAAGSLLALCTSPAFSLGFGKSSNDAGLGQPLAFSASVMLGAGEVLSERCVAADVLAGESRIEASQVRVRIEPATVERPATLHVTTGVAIVEPVVTVDIQLGCPARVSRRFVALLDPPLIREAAAAAAATRSIAVEPAREVPASAPAPASAPGPAPATRAASPPARTASPAKRPAPRRTTAAAPARRSAENGVPGAKVRASRPASPAHAAASEAPPPRPASRLSLDPLESAGAPAGAAAQLAGAASTASAATAAASEVVAAAARAAEQRIRHLDDELTRIQRENAEMRDSLAALNARLRTAQASRDDRWLWALGLLCLALAVALVWLLRRQANARPPAWWNESMAEPPATAARDSAFEHGEPTAAAALQVREPMAEDPVAPPPPSAAVRAEPLRMAAVEPVRAAAAPAEPPGTASRSERRALAVEELIDLEQQADFFLVLGQDEAAIDLLMTHVRSSGGESPMPYLKLLEIYRRRGDAPAYARIRERFNHRFNAYAPEWADDARPSTRTLEDYPRVIERLQQVWGEPWQAMDLLDTLLFRPESTDISFDLPAYADLLFLYSVAGHLSEGGGPVTHVDLLLPLDGDMAPSEISAIERTTPYLPVPPARSGDSSPPELSLVLDLDLDHPGDPAPRG